MAVLAVCVALLVGGLFLAPRLGDSGPGPDPEEASPDPVVAEPWPLTGVSGEDEPSGQVVVVKVDNTANATPQVGLDSADVVVEELVEGGLTRLAVMLHSRLAGTRGTLSVGPVRSVRSSDVGIVAPTQGLLVASGGAGKAVNDLDRAGIETAFEGEEGGFTRADDRPSPYNVIADVAELQQTAADPDGAVPEDYFAFGPAPAEGRRAGEVLMRFSPSSDTTLSHTGKKNGGSWARPEDRSGTGAAGGGFRADTVVVLRVQTRDAGYLDPAGNPVPETITTGSGTGWLLHGTRATKITWSKAEEDVPWSFALEGAGEEVFVPPGLTWVALVPEEGSVRVDKPATG